MWYQEPQMRKQIPIGAKDDASLSSSRRKPHVLADYSLYARLVRQARPYRGHLVGVFLLSTLASPISQLIPLPLKIAVDSALGDHPLPSFLAILPGTAIHSSTA